MQDGRVFILGVGVYDDTNPATATDIATLLDALVAANGASGGHATCYCPLAVLAPSPAIAVLTIIHVLVE